MSTPAAETSGPANPHVEPTRDDGLPRRNLVLCLDGTSNQFADKNTNVIKLFSVLYISPGYQNDMQMAYYDSGVGTYLPVGASGTWSGIKQELGKDLDLAIAWNFDDHVKNAYKWLMDYYQDKDRIYLFGFSRGAYAVRALAGMIERVGLLPAGLYSQISLAYDVYKTLPNEQSNHLAAKYRSIFGISRQVNVHFIGVWDTVSSLGGLSAPDLPFASTVSTVTYFRQALALNERRVKFQPEFRRPAPQEPADIAGKIPRNKEVWFLGVHSSVGGGDDEDDGPSLSNISFRWMLHEAVQCGLRTGPIGILQAYALMSIPTVDTYIRRNVPDVHPFLTVHPGESTGVLSRNFVADNETRRNLRDRFDEAHRKQVVRIAAVYDTDMASAVTADLESREKESLVGAYVVMELSPGMHRRWYKRDPQTGSYQERRDILPHMADPRYMLYDHKIHRSVLKKTLRDGLGGRESAQPRAHLPPRQGVLADWETLLAEGNQGESIWEVTA